MGSNASRWLFSEEKPPKHEGLARQVTVTFGAANPQPELHRRNSLPSPDLEVEELAEGEQAVLESYRSQARPSSSLARSYDDLLSRSARFEYESESPDSPRRSVVDPRHWLTHSAPDGVAPRRLEPPDSIERHDSLQNDFYSGSSIVRWRVGAELGCGSYGKVFSALNEDTGQLFAVKQVILVGSSSREIEEFDQELFMLQALQHKNIVQYFGSRVENNFLYIFMEHLPKGSIADWLRQMKPHGECFKEPLVRKFARDILHGLDYLHSRHVLHKDLKGANVLVDSMGTAKLADFGISTHLMELMSAQRLDDWCGSLSHLAPEVIANNLTAGSPAADVWSVGCIVYEMFTGCALFSYPRDLEPPFGEFAYGPEPPIPDASACAIEFTAFCVRRDVRQRPTVKELLQHPFIGQPADPRPSRLGSTALPGVDVGTRLTRSANPSLGGSAAGPAATAATPSVSMQQQHQPQHQQPHIRQPFVFSSAPRKPLRASNSAVPMDTSSSPVDADPPLRPAAASGVARRKASVERPGSPAKEIAARRVWSPERTETPSSLAARLQANKQRRSSAQPAVKEGVRYGWHSHSTDTAATSVSGDQHLFDSYKSLVEQFK